MQEKWADLHIHTNKSDGMHSVEEIFEKAKQVNLSAISITDHDTVAAIKKAKELATVFGIEFIPGVELSSMYDGKEVHIVGLFINWEDKEFVKNLNYFQKKRVERAMHIINKLKENKLDIKFEELYEMTENMNNIGRLHIARLLVKKGYVKSIRFAFEKFLSEGRPAYVEKAKLSVKEAINIVKKANGLAILAHPGDIERDDMIKVWKEQGLDGIEVFHPDHSNEDSMRYMDYAKKYELLISGGSDFHGEIKEYALMGKIKLPFVYFENMKNKILANNTKRG